MTIPTNQGLIRTIVVILIALLLLSYFGLNIRSITSSSTFQDNWAFVKSLLVDIWNAYVKPAFIYLRNAAFPNISLHDSQTQATTTAH